MEGDEDISVEFDLRAGIKQTAKIAKMKYKQDFVLTKCDFLTNCCRKIIAMEEQIQMNQQRKMLLDRETKVCKSVGSVRKA